MSKSKDCLVIYESDDEVIVCLKSLEDKTIKDFFRNGGRDQDDYWRLESCDAIRIFNRLSVG